MTEHSPHSSPNPEHIRESRVHIKLPAQNEIDERFAQDELYSLTFVHDEHVNECPEIVESLYLEATRSDTEVPLVAGSVEIKRRAITRNPNVWPTGLLDKIKGDITNHGYSTIESDLDDREFYVPINNYFKVRISAVLEAQTFIIKAELVGFGDDVVVTEPMSTGLGTHQVAKMLELCIASCLESFSNRRGRYSALSLDATQPTSTEVDLESTDRSVPLLGAAARRLTSEEMRAAELEAISKPRGLEDIGGAYGPKRTLSELANVYNHREEAAQYGVAPFHFMLHGPSGTGKTSLARGFAHTIGASLHEISSTKIVDMWVGNSAKHMEEIFKRAYKSTEPVVLFFDEIDSWVANNGRSGGEAEQALRIFQQQFNGPLNEHPHVVVAAATNHDPGDLPAALIRAGRLKPIDVPAPTEQERSDIWLTLLQQEYWKRESLDQQTNPNKPNFNPVYHQTSESGYNIALLGKSTEGYTGSDIRQFIENALHACFMEHLATGKNQYLTLERLLAAIK